MAGYREFQTGEVLTAANVNNFLMEQATMTFADDAARDAALASVLREGLLTYNLDTNRLEVYDGTDWVEPAPPPPPQNLVAVKSALFTGTQTDSVTSGDNLTVTDLEITHAVADPANRLIISAFLGAAASDARTGQVGIAVHDGTGLIAIGDADGNRRSVTAGGRNTSAGDSNVTVMPSITFVHTPNTTNSKTYTVRAINISRSTRKMYVNRTEGDANSEAVTRAVSSLVIQEVRA